MIPNRRISQFGTVLVSANSEHKINRSQTLKTIATMKAKNILMTLLLVTGAIAAKASGYPPELALVSQPVMVYNYNSVTVYYDVENIGDYTYRGYVYLYLDPDDGYYYAREYVRVYPGRIKRIKIEIPSYRTNPRWVYTIMPYYELDRELYSFTTFEYFEPLEYYWNGPRSHHYIVINVPPRPRYYHRPGTYRYYYDGFRPPMPPPGHGPLPPLDPHHHTYGYHHEHGGYPANHMNGSTPPPASNDHHGEAPNATVRPKENAGSMSSGHYNSGTNTPPAPTNNGSNSGRINSGSDSGRTGNSGRVNSSTTNSGSTGTSGRTGNSSSSSSVNSSSSSSSSSSGRTGNSSSGSSRVNSSSSNSSSSSGRTGNSSSSSSRVNSSSSSTRSSGTSSSSTRSSSSTSSSRSGSNSSSSTRSGSNSSSRGSR